MIGIQKAVDYIENNLCEKIDYAQAAKCACMSAFHFQRVFAAVCGFTVGDYIRMRRLTLAGSEIINTDKKIIDIALDFGYDSPESFSRAFSRFHGISPSEARKSGKIKSFSRISVKLVLMGGDTMEYKIEKRGPIKLVCRRKRVAKLVDDTAVKAVYEFWNECQKDGTVKRLCERIPSDTPMGGLLGISFSSDLNQGEFPYGIGFALGEKEVDTSDFDVVEIPEYTYAVFTVRGKMPEAFTETYKRICTEFFPQSDYEYASGVEFEVYPSDDVQNPDYTCEIWIAVK